MASHDSDAEEAITKEEIEGTAPAPVPTTSGGSQATSKRNAFTELMSPRAKIPATANFYHRSSIKPTSFSSRDGLGAYIADPASFPASRVIYHSEHFVAINDMYPKSSVHTLLLPRDARWNKLHPFDAFSASPPSSASRNPQGQPGKSGDEEARRAFLALVQAEAQRLKILVAKELQRKFGKFSAQDRLRKSVLNDEVPWDPETPLPRGRDWEAEVLVGVHARPSMNHLHIHVLSRDMFSECMKHRKHYNSFNTPFLIDAADFPLKGGDGHGDGDKAGEDPRLHPGKAGYMDSDLKCWRCGRNFGNKFKQLKEHLAEEFEEWKRE
ncbi:hypothetical protein Micbo1qcDRAFT_203198 [Microdochium bolleyi]|uniref:Aprataxin-like protein n=1 Tax=Microdochium bolleyi TaxID=196109 RepID=A0A136J7C0_9PEZI|nr:hypothetical protein Micbo1qcDRAFT_203198 [Microdochium bolleyi]